MPPSIPRVLIDCDPGIDDCLALVYLAALHHAGEIELIGVTTTAGNVTTNQTAANATWWLQLLGLGHIPVCGGQTAPAQVPLTITPETHGPVGMGYLHPPHQLPTPAADVHYMDLWHRATRTGAHLIITGPMTNAAAFLAAGHSLHGCASLTVMGGAINYRGNTTPTAEWNFWVDPHAARDVFDALGTTPTIPRATLCSLEVTEQMLLTPHGLDELIQLLAPHPVAELLPELLRFYFEFHQVQGEGYQAQIHDLLTCMIALNTISYTAQETTIAVEAESPLLRGTSVADLRGHWDRPANARLVTHANIDEAVAQLHRAAGILRAQATSTPGTTSA